MKKLLVSLILFSCCVLMWSPHDVLAQAQFPYLQPVYQPYQPYATPYQPSYIQPYQPYATPYQPSYIQPYQPYYDASQSYMQPIEPPVYAYPPVQSYSSCQPERCQSRDWCSATQMYRCGLSLVYARRYYEAMQVFQSFLRFYPRSSLADNALYWTGECYYAQKNYYRAISYFHRVIAEYSRGNKVPDAMLKIALSHISLKQYAEACRWLNDLRYRYPRSEAARKAYRWMDCCGSYDRCYHDYRTYERYEPQDYYDNPTFPKNW